jgi:thioester reductase-like protein
LTGATGYLGRFVLCELLKQTNAVIYCLVRAQTPEAGFERIKQTLINCGLWQDRYANQIIAVAGDLKKTHFGLTDPDYQSLSEHTQKIIHCGASVNLIYPYSAVKPTIVNGTEVILQLASTGTIKSVHYVSSNGIYPNLASYFTENQSIDGLIDHLHNGYSQAKWVAESMIWQAHTQGIPTTVYRPGNLGPHSELALLNQQDFNYLMLQAGMQTAYLPASFTLETTPVDWIAHSIVAISNHDPGQGQAYNMHQPNAISGAQLVEFLRQYTGDNIQSCDYHQWLALLPRQSQIGHLLDLHHDELLNPQPTIDQKQFEAMVSQFQLPHALTADVLEHFINLCQWQNHEVTTYD